MICKRKADFHDPHFILTNLYVHPYYLLYDTILFSKGQVKSTSHLTFS